MKRSRFSEEQIIAVLKEQEVRKLNATGRPIRDDEGNSVLTGKYQFHALRHSAATSWIADKIDLKRSQVRIGHEGIQLMLDTCSHLLADQERDAEPVTPPSKDLFR